MSSLGVLPGRSQDKVTLRVQSLQPFSSEMTGEQIGVIADIAEKYGSGAVHVTPRQTIEIPDLPPTMLADVQELLTRVGLHPGSSGEYLRNVISCSQWCLFNVHPLNDLAARINRKFYGQAFPAKTLISLSGCDFSCVRSRTSDIGVIGRAEIALTDNECKGCGLCVKEPLGCQVDAITLSEAGVAIDSQRCVRCGFCSNVCRPGTIVSQEKGFDLLVGGRGGLKPHEASLLKTLPSEEDLEKEIIRLLDEYCQKGLPGERLGETLARNGKL